MKTIKFFGMMALAAIAMIACKPKNAPEANAPVDETGTTGWMCISLNTPTTAGSNGMRVAAADNDQFADGLSTEFRVRQAILVFFEQKNTTDAEDAFVYHSSYDLGVNPSMYEPVNDQVTSRATSAIEVKNVPSNLYLLVIGNPNNVISHVGGALKLINGKTVTKGITTFADFTGDFAKIADDVNVLTNNGSLFTMTNSPVVHAQTNGGGAQAPAGNVEVKTLVKVDNSRLYASETEALNATLPTADVYLERVVAKVSLAVDATATNLTAKPTVPFVIDGWILDNTNTETYLVRNVEDVDTYMGLYSEGVTGFIAPAGKYRFVGYQPFSYNGAAPGEGADHMYRYYWAKDPNYDAAGSFNDMTTHAFLPINETKPQYCMENTFDVDHQVFSQTTRVIIRAKFNNGADFYTIGKSDDILPDETALKTALASTIVTAVLQKIADDKIVWVGAPLTASNWESFFTIDVTSINSDNVITPVATLTATGEAAIQNYNYGDATPEQTAARAAWNDACADARARNPHVQKFNGGYSYYQARIKHFGDDLTPWLNWEAGKGETVPVSGDVSTIYPNTASSADSKYLGRYGMVRNNWYALNVTSIKHIGSPVIPTITGDDEPDDELDSYMSLKINILSWAKRAQNLDL